jgi:hypothetical protein
MHNLTPFESNSLEWTPTKQKVREVEKIQVLEDANEDPVGLVSRR